MTPLHTDDDQIRRLDEMVRAIHESLMAANGARHDKATRAHYLQRMQKHVDRLVTELMPPSQPESEGQNRVFDLGE